MFEKENILAYKFMELIKSHRSSPWIARSS